MEPKYYTPAIEEFCVGFEYEVRQAGGWVKEKFNYTECMSDFSNTEEYRVKTLDTQDILDSGFKKDADKDYFVIVDGSYEIGEEATGCEYHLFFEKDVHGFPKITIYGYEIMYGEAHLPIENDCGCIFSGQVKNKSELKVLLRQLNIK